MESGVARLCAGVERFFAGLSSLLRAKREPEKHRFSEARAREKGCSPLSDPKEEVETEKC
jgi:hypothetical protein